MKAEIFKTVVIIGIVALGLASCAQPKESNNDSSYMGSKIDNSEAYVNRHQDSMRASVDSMIDHSVYSSVIEARFNQNDEKLKEMKKNLKSKVTAVQLEYDQELTELNERNLKIKTNVNDYVNKDPESWDIFKTSINNEMNALEKSIGVLAEKVSE